MHLVWKGDKHWHVRYELWTLIGLLWRTPRSRKNDHSPTIHTMRWQQPENHRRSTATMMMIRPSDKRRKFIRYSSVIFRSLCLVLIIYVDLLFYTHAHINGYCRFSSPSFFFPSLSVLSGRPKTEKEEFPSLVDFSKDIRNRERETRWNDVWLTGTTITRCSAPLSLSSSSARSLYHQIQKMTALAKVSLCACCRWKMTCWERCWSWSFFWHRSTIGSSLSRAFFSHWLAD